MNKNQFRKDMLKLRNDLSKHYTDLASEEISDKFLTSALYNRAINIFIFVSYNKEVNTHKIIKKALEDGKNIFIPVVDRQTMTMSISKLKDFNKLEENYMGILEPKKEDITQENPQDLDLIVVPGLAFDLEGYRMGYGGGFYDKFFETINPKITRLGIGYFKQFVKEVPHDEYDKKLHYFLSENGLLTLGGH